MSYNSPFTGNVVQPTDVSYRSVTLAANTQLSWPINGNATDDYAARIMNVTASSAGLALWMPPANQASVGQDALIRNVGSNTFTVSDFSGQHVIASVAAGEAKYIYITTNSTTAGSWGVIAFGVGSSNPDAGALAGAGLTAIANTLNQSHPTESVIAAYTFASDDRAKTLEWTGGSTGVYLPLAANVGDNWFILLKNNGTGTMTVNTTSGELLDGAIAKTFQPGDSAIIVCTGSAYVTIGYGQSTVFQFNALTKPVTGGTTTLSASEASNFIIIFTGTLTSNVTVVFPPVISMYVISNQTSAGGFTLTCTTGTLGASNATVPTGGQATLICDGANFLNANTSQAGASSLSLANGSPSSPTLNFASETNTGVYRPGSGRFGVAVLGSLVLDVTATGISVSGTGNFTGGVTAASISVSGTGNFVGGISSGTFS